MNKTQNQNPLLSNGIEMPWGDGAVPSETSTTANPVFSRIDTSRFYQPQIQVETNNNPEQELTAMKIEMKDPQTMSEANGFMSTKSARAAIIFGDHAGT